MEYIPGKTMLHDNMNKDERRDAIAALVRLQCSVHAINADGLPKLADRLARKITCSEFIAQSVKDDLLSLLNRLKDGSNNLCHGGFHPLNVLYDRNKYWIIDWVDATAGSLLADACRTYLIFAATPHKAGASLLRAFLRETLSKMLAISLLLLRFCPCFTQKSIAIPQTRLSCGIAFKQFMMHSAGIYLSAFCKEAGVKKDAVLAWLPIVAAARLSEKMDGKARARLLKVIEEQVVAL